MNYQEEVIRTMTDMAGKIGSPAVDFELPDAAGVMHRLSQYAGSWLLVVFHRHLG